MFPARFTELCVTFVVVRNATERIPEHLRERFKFHIQQLPKVVQEILKYVSCGALPHSYSILCLRCCVLSFRTERITSVFTALHGMQTQSSDENSVCSSFRLSSA